VEGATQKLSDTLAFVPESLERNQWYTDLGHLLVIQGEKEEEYEGVSVVVVVDSSR